MSILLAVFACLDPAACHVSLRHQTTTRQMFDGPPHRTRRGEENGAGSYRSRSFVICCFYKKKKKIKTNLWRRVYYMENKRDGRRCAVPRERDNVSSIQEIERITHHAADTLARRKSSFHYLLYLRDVLPFFLNQFFFRCFFFFSLMI